LKCLVFLLLTTFGAALYSGCKPDDPENWTRYEYLDEARDYIYFKTRTWWVYRRIPGGELDTIEVLNDWIDTVKLTGNGNTLYFENIEWTAKSRMDAYEYKICLSVSLPVSLSQS
jgi:hypothetical protein